MHHSFLFVGALFIYFFTPAWVSPLHRGMLRFCNYAKVTDRQPTRNVHHHHETQKAKPDAFPPTWGLCRQTTSKTHVCWQVLSFTLPQSGRISRSRGRWGTVGVSDFSVGAPGWCLGGCTGGIRSSDPWQLPIKQLSEVQSISSGSSSTRSQ